jgi:hypothetical protein
MQMPGSRHYTQKEERQIQHIIESELEQGRSREDAERIGYATVNKQRNEDEKDKGQKKRDKPK